MPLDNVVLHTTTCLILVEHLVWHFKEAGAPPSYDHDADGSRLASLASHFTLVCNHEIKSRFVREKSEWILIPGQEGEASLSENRGCSAQIESTLQIMKGNDCN